MSRSILPLFVVAFSSIASIAFAQASPERESQLLSQHNAISPLVNQIVNQKVVPVFNNLASNQVAPIDQQDIQTLLNAIDLSSTIQIELSGDSAAEPVEAAPEYRTVYRWVPVRGLFGRCKYRCVAVYETVPQKSLPKHVRSRQPLADAIQQMTLYFEDRLNGGAGTAEEDRAAALQTLSILQIVNPAFKAGEIVQ